MVDIRHLKCLAQCACGFNSRPGHKNNEVKARALADLFFANRV